MDPAAASDPPRANDVEDADSSSDSTDPNDETFDDWVEDPIPCKSLFDDVDLPSVTEALKYDLEKHAFDLNEVSRRLNLDFHRRVRFVNYIRANKVSSADALKISGSEEFFSDDVYLKPAIVDDPLLLIESDDWSDSEEEGKPKVVQDAGSEIEYLRAELAAKNAQISQLRTRYQELLSGDAPAASTSTTESKPRDDDSHYFESYGFQEIHATMIRDSVRTMSYAKFILSNPDVFRDKLVMDVGCGTGILSMFAARAGAKHVFAIDASDIALKARRNIKDSELDSVITVIQGKVESIKLPAPYDDPSVRVDVIISEWMGYALLYESMLDSVLVARDRFLRPPQADGSGAGIMAPSQCKMILSLADASEVWKERVTFWEDVHGFKMTAMADEAFGDALVEHLPSDSIASNLLTIKDLPTQRITTKELQFSSPFTFTVTREKDGNTIHAFLLYFDTYFTPDGADVPEDATPTIHEAEGNFRPGDILSVGRLKRTKSMKERERESQRGATAVSFSTGPQSLCTHWKQSVFLLKQPFKAIEGTEVKGTFHLTKNEENSRELNVEIHYSVSHTGLGPHSGTTVLMYKVR